MNADTITASDFIYALYKNFRNKKWINNDNRTKPSAPPMRKKRAPADYYEEEDESANEKSFFRRKFGRGDKV